jgi:hypothetical protein
MLKPVPFKLSRPVTAEPASQDMKVFHLLPRGLGPETDRLFLSPGFPSLDLDKVDARVAETLPFWRHEGQKRMGSGSPARHAQ